MKTKTDVKFTTKTYQKTVDPVFSILIPTWNNLEMLKLCVASIAKNSAYRHQIILHINEGKDGTKLWAEEQELDHSFSPNNIGVCYAVNAAASLATAEYILYVNDDMYLCPQWDKYLLDEAKQMPDKLFYLSATAIEPVDVGKKCAIAPYSFGSGPEDFREADLLSQYATLPMQDWNGSSWPPSLVHRDVWNLLGGYSAEFFPGFYSDPDFSLKLWNLGVRTFKGVAKSRVYHFLEYSTKRLGHKKVKQGNRIFLNKWGITASMFNKFYLRMGTSYQGPLPEPKITFAFWKKKLACYIKKMLSKNTAVS